MRAMTSLKPLLSLLAVCLPFATSTAAEQPAPPIPPCEPASAGNITYAEIIARYADADSQFAVLEGKDGIRTHFKDQGSGPAILLIHSSFGDLNDWDGWVATLADDYRVVRFDLPAFGLTGPVPSGNYSIDRYLTLVDSLMDHLGIDRFAIAGTSYGGLVAFRYAATRTERVTALILQSSAGIEYGGRGGTAERERDVEATFKPRRATREMFSETLQTVINDSSKVTPELVARKTDFANVVGRDWEAFVAARMYERGNPERVLGHVRAPSLVLWGGSSKALSVSTAQAFADALSNAKAVKKIIYEGGGHLLHIERPEQTARDVKDFLDQYVGDKD
jgi:pimeloyl-ACP methyl ester carboxylesterase